MRVQRKRNLRAPPGLFEYEFRGLRWLSDVADGVPCAQVITHDATSVELEYVASVPPDPAAAHEFGRRLAITHDAGAAAFGAPPDGWTGPGYFGPSNHPLPMSLTEHATWGTFYADERLAPALGHADSDLTGDARRAVAEVVQRCRAGRFDDDDGPARLHGDLWSGNVLWSSRGVVLIDPAAHGGHREADLAMLALFGCPHLETVFDGYQSRRRLRPGWRERRGLHQLFPLLMHVALFGSAYVSAVTDAMHSALDLATQCRS